jgi:hypothetical protein
MQLLAKKLDLQTGTVSFSLDNIITATGSSVQIGTGQVTIALPTIVDVNRFKC